MQSFKNSIDLPASAARVVELITTEDYLRFRYENDAVQDFSLDVIEDTAESFRYTLKRTIDTGSKVPKMAQKMVGDSITVSQSQNWTRSHAPFGGTMQVEAAGLPGSIEAATEVIEVDENNSKLIVNGQVNVKIPLVGGQLEKLLVSRIEESFFQSGDSVRDYIKRQQS